MAARCRDLLQCHRKFCFSGSSLGNKCFFSSSATIQGRPDLWEVYKARKDRIKGEEIHKFEQDALPCRAQWGLLSKFIHN